MNANEYEGRELATKVVLQYFQEWGQSPQARVLALMAAATWAGVDAADFLDRITACWPLGRFEDEAEAVYKVMLNLRQQAVGVGD